MKHKHIIITKTPEAIQWKLIDGEPTVVFSSGKILTQEDKDQLFKEVFEALDGEQ